MNPNEIQVQVTSLIKELAEKPGFRPVRVLVIGCSSSEITGGVIGHHSSLEYGEAVARGVLAACSELGIAPCFQCCEHLNRALVTERETAEKYGFEIVSVVPKFKAGGSCATNAYALLHDPVVVETACADAGIDIGQTLIGMHLRPVAVPVRLTQSTLGSAVITAARTRPKLIGGERAEYR